MACPVCGAHPTWADVSECSDDQRQDCPWLLDMSLPFPPLSTKLMNPPPLAPVATPKPVAKQPAHGSRLPAVASGTQPQPHSWNAKAAKLIEGMAPPPTVTPIPSGPPTTSPPPAKSWASIAKAPAKPGPAPKQAVKPQPPVAAPAKKQRKLTTTKQRADFNEIMRYVDTIMQWSGPAGPTAYVKCKMDWTDNEGRNLYLFVKDELHDQQFQTGSKTLYFYVGTMGVNWGKAGFRISGHSKPLSKLNNSKTHGVLHVANN